MSQPLCPSSRATRRAVLALGAAAALSACQPTRSDPVRLIVGADAGGGNDAFCRLFGRHLQRISGRTIQVENEGRAGGKLAADLLSRAKPDGATLALLPVGLIYDQLLDGAKATFDMRAFCWVAGVGADRRVLLVNRKSGVTAFRDLLTRRTPLLLPATSVGSANYIEPLIVSYLTGAPLKPVPGYRGGTRNLAVLSGEGDGLVGGLDGMGALLDAPGSRLLLRLNDRQLTGAMSGTAPPLLSQFAKGPDAAALIELVQTHAELGRIFALPPGASASVLTMWRDHFAAVIADPAFRAEAAKGSFQLEPLSGDQVARALNRVLGTAGPVASALRRALAVTPTQ